MLETRSTLVLALCALFMAVACAAADKQIVGTPVVGMVRQLLAKEEDAEIDCEKACPETEEVDYVSEACCKCMKGFVIKDFEGLTLCVEEGVNLNMLSQELRKEIKERLLSTPQATGKNKEGEPAEFRTQATIEDLEEPREGSLPIVNREREYDRGIDLKTTYNEKTRDITIEGDGSRDFVSRTQYGLLERRAQALQDTSLQTTFDRSAITNRVKSVSTELNRDRLIEVAGVVFVPRFVVNTGSGGDDEDA